MPTGTLKSDNEYKIIVQLFKEISDCMETLDKIDSHTVNGERQYFKLFCLRRN